jgi:hypothetical protein
MPVNMASYQDTLNSDFEWPQRLILMQNLQKLLGMKTLSPAAWAFLCVCDCTFLSEQIEKIQHEPYFAKHFRIMLSQNILKDAMVVVEIAEIRPSGDP